MDIPNELRPTGTTGVLLPGGVTISLPVCRPVFSLWDGPTISFDYGKKPVLNYKGEACFVELVILRTLIEHGWNGVWVETYGGTHYLRTMPNEWKLGSEHVSIPADKEELLQKIWKTAKTTACFDVLAWNNGQILFCEAKRAKKDRLTDAQLRFHRRSFGMWHLCKVTSHSRMDKFITKVIDSTSTHKLSTTQCGRTVFLIVVRSSE